jgi:hypothetical protein
MDEIKYNLNKQQTLKFNEIYKATVDLYPHLVSDYVNIERTKGLIAHCVITDDAPIIIDKSNEVVLNLDADLDLKETIDEILVNKDNYEEWEQEEDYDSIDFKERENKNINSIIENETN